MIYLTVLLILVALAFTDYINVSESNYSFRKVRKIYRNVLYIFLGIALILISGLRYYTGFDYANYSSIFHNMALGQPVGNIEVGYKALNYLVSRFTTSATTLFFIVALLIVIIKMIAIKAESEKIFLSLFICFTLYFFIGDMGQIRSTLAQSIDLLAIVFFIKDKKIYKVIAFILMCVAVLFHMSAAALLIVFIFRDMKFKIRTYAIAYAVLAVLGQLLNLKAIGEFGKSVGGFIGDKLYVYTTNSEFAHKVGISSNVIFDFIMFVIILYAIYRYNLNENKKFRYLFNIYFFGIASYLVLNNYFVLAVRFANYFRLSLIFLIPILLSNIKNKKERMVILTIIILMLSLMVVSLLKGDANMYLPYRMDLFGYVIGG